MRITVYFTKHLPKNNNNSLKPTKQQSVPLNSVDTELSYTLEHCDYRTGTLLLVMGQISLTVCVCVLV